MHSCVQWHNERVSVAPDTAGAIYLAFSLKNDIVSLYVGACFVVSDLKNFSGATLGILKPRYRLARYSGTRYARFVRYGTVKSNTDILYGTFSHRNGKSTFARSPFGWEWEIKICTETKDFPFPVFCRRISPEESPDLYGLQPHPVWHGWDISLQHLPLCRYTETGLSVTTLTATSCPYAKALNTTRTVCQ